MGIQAITKGSTPHGGDKRQREQVWDSGDTCSAGQVGGQFSGREGSELCDTLYSRTVRFSWLSKVYQVDVSSSKIIDINRESAQWKFELLPLALDTVQ